MKLTPEQRDALVSMAHPDSLSDISPSDKENIRAALEHIAALEAENAELARQAEDRCNNALRPKYQGEDRG